MSSLRPIELIIVGFFLSLFGCAVPFLTVVKVIPPSFFLLFLSYAASFIGVLLGLIGAATYVRGSRR
jgi:hypothetical protein